MRYRNTGAPIPRDGEWIERGQVFEPTEEERRTLAYKLEPMEEPEEEPEPDPLEGVDFGSPEARELAEDEDLTSSDFEGRLGTGEGHAFLVSDVERLLEDS